MSLILRAAGRAASVSLLALAAPAFAQSEAPSQDAVLKTYADIALATYEDALTRAKALNALTYDMCLTIDRALIDLGLLTSEEIAWIDAYHARVADEIGPLVDEATKEWLEQATRPIG